MEEFLSGSRGAKSVTDDSLRNLHPSEISDESEIFAVLRQISDAGSVLRRGVNRRIDPETATIERLDPGRIFLRVKNFEATTAKPGSTVFLNTSLDGLPLFFAASVIALEGTTLQCAVPSAVFRAERRDRARRFPRQESDPMRVRAEFSSRTRREGIVSDVSPDGLSILVDGGVEAQRGDRLRVEFLDGSRSGERLYAQVRNLSTPAHAPGWKRLGMNVSPTPFSDPIDVYDRRYISGTRLVDEARGRLRAFAGSMAAATSPLRRRSNRNAAVAPPVIEIVDYENSAGERIRAILDSHGERQHATAVVIPPAWGKTKETLLPLARTIVETFRKARKPVVVVRYDGIRKRGESYNEPECRLAGREHHRFTFSQGVRDIQATLDFLGAWDTPPSKTVLVTFSAASIEGRRAVALEPERLSGWISVVGAADLQSAMRVVSGGIDYLGGVERGVSFGIQEVQGVAVDIDVAAPDAIRHRLAFMEDARQDMARIRTPVSWIHGRYDAWMDLERVRLLLGVGDQSKRQLLVVPTGHQLRSSVEALQVFQLIAREVSALALGAPVPAGVPDLAETQQRGAAERARLPRVTVDRRRFWKDYLLGRNGRLGIELMTATSAYSEVMSQQIDLLDLSEGDAVVDLGCGTGAFSDQLLESRSKPQTLAVTSIDYVTQALKRVRTRRGTSQSTITSNFISADLELFVSNPRIPLADESQNAVLASLLISYVNHPETLLREIHRVLKPGGRLVISALRPDADTSRIFVSGADELRAGRAKERFGDLGATELEASLRSFLNDAARLIDMEEQGVFHFWPAEDLAALVQSIGFVEVATRSSFGNPPQAIVIRGRKAPAQHSQ